jgi:hypothetical protein
MLKRRPDRPASLSLTPSEPSLIKTLREHVALTIRDKG